MFKEYQKLNEVITALGIYVVIILEVRYIKSSNSIFFLVETETGKKSDFYLNLQFLNGERNDISYKLMRSLLDLLEIEDVDPDKSNHFVELEGKSIGVLLKPYFNKKNIKNMNCVCWFDPETYQTSWEKAQDINAEYIYRKEQELAELENNEESI